MRKHLSILLLFLATWLATWAGTGTANAGLIFLSGDANIGNPIDGSSTSPVNPDNATFFLNVLGTSTRVLIQNELPVASLESSWIAVNNLYNAQPGISSTIVGSGTTIDGAALDGVGLFFGVLPQASYTAAEIAALTAHLDGGGTVFLAGENGDFFDAENNRINELLAALGSSMTLLDVGLSPAFGDSSNIDADPFTAGMSSFTYAYGSSVLGGTSLIRHRDDSDAVLIAYDSPVPVPATLVLTLTGIAALWGTKRRLH